MSDGQVPSSWGQHDNTTSILKRIRNNFPESASLTWIAHYAEDEYMIPCDMAFSTLHKIVAKEKKGGMISEWIR